MHSLHSSRQRSTQRSRPLANAARLRSRGVAQIEILMGLVIYTTLLLLLMAIGSGVRAIAAAHEGARAQAWDLRASPTPGDSLGIDTRSLGQWLGPGDTPPKDAGLLSGSAEGALFHVLPGVTDQLAAPSRPACTVTGAWDHDHIRFARDAGQHPPLTPDRQTQRAVQGKISTSRWKALAK